MKLKFAASSSSSTHISSRMTFLRLRKTPATASENRIARQRQQLRQRDHGRFSASIFTMRTRSLARTATCALMSCCLQPGAAAHGQRDGGDDRHQQQHGRKLERIGVAGVQHTARARACCCSRPAARRRGSRRCRARRVAHTTPTISTITAQRGEPAEPGEAREALAQLRQVDVEHHDDEQEQHHHRADVHQHQHDGEELRLEQQPDRRAR